VFRRPSSPEPASVEVINPSDGGFWFWLFKFYAFAVLCAVGLVILGGIGLYAHFASTLPALPDFARYRLEAAESTRVHAWDGTDLAELASERREILPL
jgi:membrane carboxypeptidase/penicillin-binding protein